MFPRGTCRFLVKKGVLMHPFAVSAMKHSIWFFVGGSASGRGSSLCCAGSARCRPYVAPERSSTQTLPTLIPRARILLAPILLARTLLARVVAPVGRGGTNPPPPPHRLGVTPTRLAQDRRGPQLTTETRAPGRTKACAPGSSKANTLDKPWTRAAHHRRSVGIGSAPHAPRPIPVRPPPVPRAANGASSRIPAPTGRVPMDSSGRRRPAGHSPL